MRPNPDLQLHKLDVAVSKVVPQVVEDLAVDLAAAWVLEAEAVKSISPTFVTTHPIPSFGSSLGIILT